MSFYLTTAIDYVNSRPHLGTAYEKITADVIARYKRLCGIETRFVMGNDEHSQNVFRRAREEGKDPLAYCDEMEAVFRDVWGRLSISFDDFIRTTEPRHRAAVQRLVERCRERGDIYEGQYEG
jgi:methionyl-tRNA synthetase